MSAANLPSWPRIRALLRAEGLALARDKWTTLSLVIMLVLVGAGAHLGAWMPDLDGDRDEEPEEVGATWPCARGELGAVALAGQAPAWLRWPDPWVDAAEAKVLLRVEEDDRPRIEVVALHEDAPTRRVEGCVQHRLDSERDRRLRALGVTERPGALARLEQALPLDEAGTPTERPTAAPLGAALAAGLFLLLVSLYLELGPRARASGFVEAWLSLPGRRGDLVWAWWLVGLSSGAAGVGLILLGHLVGAAFSGLPAEPVVWTTVPFMVPLAAAIGVRTFLDVEDMRTAITRSMPVVFSVTLLAGVALWVQERWPDLAGLVPVAGLGLAMSGRATPAGTGLAMVSAVFTTALLLASSLRLLETLSARTGALSRTAARRAAGDYRPEVLLLALVAMAGSTSWVPAPLLGDDLVLSTLLSLSAFVLAPALLISAPLGLPRGELLSWRRPPARAWALLPFVVAGSLSLATLLWHLGLVLVPPNETLALYAEAMAGFDAPLGLVVISVLPGLGEELLYRGAILGLLRRGWPTWAALVGQAALFALAHGLAVRLPYTFGLGLLFGLLTLRTGSLGPAIVAHAAHNLLAATLGEHLPGPEQPWPWLFAALGLAAVGLAGRNPASAPRG